MFSISKNSNNNPLLENYTISNSNISCKIYQNLGGTLQELQLNGKEIIKGINNTENGLDSYKPMFQSSFLFPFPGRVENGLYSYNSVQYQLECNEEGRNNALHGLVYNKAFSVEETHISKEKAILRIKFSSDQNHKGFPFLFDFEITYTITENQLFVSCTAKNKGASSFPFGIGWHPYFVSTALEESTLSFEAETEIICNDAMVPQDRKEASKATSVTIGGQQFDNTYITKSNEFSFETPDYKVSFEVKTPNCNYLQFYTPPSRDCIAIEPMTCIPNMFNNLEGMKELHPNESYSFDVELNFENK